MRTHSHLGNSDNQESWDLPLEVWVHIFSYLDNLSFNQLILVSHLFHKAMQNPLLWELLWKSRLECHYPVFYQFICLTDGIETIQWKDRYYQVEAELIEKMPLTQEEISKISSISDPILKLNQSKKQKSEKFQLFKRCILTNDVETFQTQLFEVKSHEIRSSWINFLLNLGKVDFLKRLVTNNAAIFNENYTQIEINIMLQASFDVILSANEDAEKNSPQDLIKLAARYGHLDLFKHLQDQYKKFFSKYTEFVSVSHHGHLLLCYFICNGVIQGIKNASTESQDVELSKILTTVACKTIVEQGHHTLFQFLVDQDIEKYINIKHNSSRLLDLIVRSGRIQMMDYVLKKHPDHLQSILWESVKQGKFDFIYHLVEHHKELPNQVISKEVLGAQFEPNQTLFIEFCCRYLGHGVQLEVCHYLFFKLAFPNFPIPYTEIRNEESRIISEIESAITQVLPYLNLSQNPNWKFSDAWNQNLNIQMSDLRKRVEGLELTPIENLYIEWQSEMKEIYQYLILKWINSVLDNKIETLDSLSRDDSRFLPPTSTAALTNHQIESQEWIATKAKLEQDIQGLKTWQKKIRQALDFHDGANLIIFSEMKSQFFSEQSKNYSIANQPRFGNGLPSNEILLPNEIWVSIFIHLDFFDIQSVFFISKPLFGLAHFFLQTAYFKEKLQTDYPAYFAIATQFCATLPWKLIYETVRWEQGKIKAQWIEKIISYIKNKAGWVDDNFKDDLSAAITSEDWYRVQTLLSSYDIDLEYIHQSLLDYAKCMQRSDLISVFYERQPPSQIFYNYQQLINYHRPVDDIKRSHPFFLNTNDPDHKQRDFLDALASGHLELVRYYIEDLNFDILSIKSKKQILSKIINHSNMALFHYLMNLDDIQTLLKENFSSVIVGAVLAEKKFLLHVLCSQKPDAHDVNLAFRAAVAEGTTEMVEYLLKRMKPSILFKPKSGLAIYNYLRIRELKKNDQGLEVLFTVDPSLRLINHHLDANKQFKSTLSLSEFSVDQHQQFILKILHDDPNQNMAWVLFESYLFSMNYIFSPYKKSDSAESSGLIECLDTKGLVNFSRMARQQKTSLLCEMIPYWNILQDPDSLLKKILENTEESELISFAFCKALMAANYEMAEILSERGIDWTFVCPDNGKTTLDILCNPKNTERDWFFPFARIMFLKIIYPNPVERVDKIASLNYLLDRFELMKPIWYKVLQENRELFAFFKEQYLRMLGRIREGISEEKKIFSDSNCTIANRDGLFSESVRNQLMEFQEAIQRCQNHIAWVESSAFEASLNGSSEMHVSIIKKS